MNPSSNETTGLNLPPPLSEHQNSNQSHTEAPAGVPEIAPNSVEHAASTTDAALPQMPATQPATVADQPLVPTQSAVPTTTHAVVPDAADDADLIEKEWVNKAKQIVERTREDPYQQNKELTVFKADYMKKRYNKTVKLSE